MHNRSCGQSMDPDAFLTVTDRLTDPETCGAPASAYLTSVLSTDARNDNQGGSWRTAVLRRQSDDSSRIDRDALGRPRRSEFRTSGTSDFAAECTKRFAVIRFCREQRRASETASCSCCPHVRSKTRHTTAAATPVGCAFSALSRIIAPVCAIDAIAEFW